MKKELDSSEALKESNGWRNRRGSDTTIQSEDATNINDNFKRYPMSLTQQRHV